MMKFQLKYQLAKNTFNKQSEIRIFLMSFCRIVLSKVYLQVFQRIEL